MNRGQAFLTFSFNAIDSTHNFASRTNFHNYGTQCTREERTRVHYVTDARR